MVSSSQPTPGRLPPPQWGDRFQARPLEPQVKSTAGSHCSASDGPSVHSTCCWGCSVSLPTRPRDATPTGRSDITIPQTHLGDIQE